MVIFFCAITKLSLCMVSLTESFQNWLVTYSIEIFQSKTPKSCSVIMATLFTGGLVGRGSSSVPNYFNEALILKVYCAIVIMSYMGFRN